MKIFIRVKREKYTKKKERKKKENFLPNFSFRRIQNLKIK